MAKLKWEDLQRMVVEEVRRAKEFVKSNCATDRTEKWDRYHGRDYGDEEAGRSQYKARDVLDGIEGVMPDLIRTFASGEPRVDIEIEGKPSIVGKALMQKIQGDLDDGYTNNRFMFFYQWFKDGLVSDTAFIKLFWTKDYEKEPKEFPLLSYEQMVKLNDAEGIDIKSFQETFQGYENVSVEKKVIKQNGLTVANIPHWEFIVSERAKFMNDEHGKGHISKVTVDFLKRISRARTTDKKEPFFKYLKDIEKEASKNDDDLDDAGVEEKLHYEDNLVKTYGGLEESQFAKAQVELAEWNDKFDVDGDGFLEDCIFWVVNDRWLIRWEINDEKFIPFCSFSPILEPYKFFGSGWADLLIDIQNMNTKIFRRVMDNFDFTNLGFWIQRSGATADIKRLLEHIPGSVVTADDGSLENVAPKPFDPRNLTILDYITSKKEERIGRSRFNEGIDAPAMGNTATGANLLQSNNNRRTDLLNRVVAETGIQDFYRKCAILYQRYMDQPFTVKVSGKDITIQPQDIQGKVKTKTNLGMQEQLGMQDIQKIERMFSFLSEVNKNFPGLLQPEQIHNLATRYVSSFGHKDTQEFLVDMEAYMKSVQQAMQQRQQMQQQQMQMEMAKIQGDQQTKQAEIQTRAQVESDRTQASREDSERKATVTEIGSRRGAETAMAQIFGSIEQSKIAARAKRG